MDSYNFLTPPQHTNNAPVIKMYWLLLRWTFFWCKIVHFWLSIYVHKYFCSDNSVVCQNKRERFQDKAVNDLSKGYV